MYNDLQGLGEIRPKEFPQFIGQEMVLAHGPIFNFHMDKNTPERKDYITDKLVVPVEGQVYHLPPLPCYL